MARQARRPDALASILYYANTRPGEDWRQVIWGPDAVRIQGHLGPGTEPVYGVASRVEAEKILGDFRIFLAQLVEAAANEIALHLLLNQLFDRASLQPDALVPNSDTGTIFVSWATRNALFTESLYARLVLTLEEIPLRRIRRCTECGDFFFAAHDRPLRFCGAKCRNRSLVRRYREGHQDEHREYQRKLMRIRRTSQRGGSEESHE